ncbi:tol-pal system-associated acyl-CoA thioesterase [Vibrio gallicus]|uniref:tol-pal system-associated acyl-CoA thioesterase n=1 Tax=Vibrio gallicus TaxID=190897 RepID=UPI0021C48BE0|nr:tol-pal system-associated acyl-CoA thioesterase [Vibrio gallicus]
MTTTSTNENSTFDWPIRIYYEDTDAGGIVYHSNYLKYFERARTELLRAKGVSQQLLLEQQLGFVVKHMDIDFLQGAQLDQELTVKTHVSQLKRVSLDFCQEIVNLDGKVLCRAVVRVACINTSKMKPTAIPNFIISEFS